MLLHTKSLARQAFVVSLFALTATGCLTGYGAQGLFGGYTDDRIDDTHYLVRFNGNGNTPKDRVWNFWFYRCAELTTQKGFAYFELEPDKSQKKHSEIDLPASPVRFAAYQPGAANPSTVLAFYTYYSVPVTTWHSSAVVAMYSTLPAGKSMISAQRVLDLLGPYVKSNGIGTTPPEQKAIFRGSIVKLGSNGAELVVPAGTTLGFVDMKRVYEETTEGKAAQAELSAFVAKKQARVDNGKAELDQLRKKYDAEADPAGKATLETKIAAMKKQLQELYASGQTEVTAERKRLAHPVTDHIGPIVEKVRSANHLDTVVEQNNGLWDKDITDEVLRLYNEAYGPKTSSKEQGL